MEIITLEEALMRGYTHFITEYSPKIVAFKKLTEDDIQYYRTKKCFIIDRQNPISYSINSETISEIIAEYMDEQEQVNDGSGKLRDICENHDYEQLASDLNQKFKAHSYYGAIDVIVAF